MLIRAAVQPPESAHAAHAEECDKLPLHRPLRPQLFFEKHHFL